MFLKRITLSGFKSFCDRVDFDFGPGVTCVVGPNGCGKSNVVDAFKWVLGEQSAHSLRGRQMMDMIFNGSSTRRSSSVAQVDLVFDNADRALGVDQEEVTVTRKLYRSGESEYLLNHEGSRLKDIRGLFLDTGVGVEAYSVIEQGKVDALLQSSPQDRRVIFEEAAGISRFKARKKEAERKLERTQQNLLRVADIIEELEKRLRSVKLQAGKARNYLEYDARLRELKSTFAMAEYHRYQEGERDLNARITDCTDRVTACRTNIDRLEADGSRVNVRLDALSEEINTVDGQLVRARSDLTAQEERIESATRRLEEQNDLLNRSLEQQRTGQDRLSGASNELGSVQSHAAELERRTQDLHARVDELSEKDRGLARELTQAQAILEDEKAGIIELLRKSAQTHNEIVRLNTHRESLVGQKGRLAQRDTQIAAELEGVLRQRTELDGRIRDIESLLVRQNRALEEKKTESTRAHAVRQRLVDELASAKEHRSALVSRREVLQDLERRMEGVGAGARRVLEATVRATDSDCGGRLDAESGRGWNASTRNVMGLVADIFDTDVAHARIIEAALGDSDQHLVAADDQGLLRLLESLGELPGRVTAFCLNRLPPLVNVRDFAEQPGVMARAVDLVRFPQDVEALAVQLLGKTIVVQDLQAALALQANDVHGYRFVTPAGEVVEADGRVVLGPAAAGSGLISRKSELKDIDVQLAGLDGRIRSLADQLNRTQAEASHLDAVQQELRTAIYEISTSKAEANATLQNIAEAMERLNQEQPLVAREVAFLETQINEVLTRAADGGRALELLEQQNKDRERLVASHQQRIDDVVTARRHIQEQMTEAKVAVGQVTEKRAGLLDTINSLRRGIVELESALARADADIEQARGRIGQAEATIASSKQETAVLAERIGHLDSAAQRLRHEREEQRLTLEGLGQTVKTTREQLAAVETELHEKQMSLAQLQVHRTNLVDRIREELGIDLAERYGQYQYEERDWQEVESEIAELRGKMERLGNVNLDAIQELTELEERYAFLSGQRNDLDEARRQLEQLIEELNTEAKDRFKVSLEQIRENFRGLFRRLFGGGRADIILEDPENILDCGIEIVAQPPGKDLQVISLMSGGEKSMTAIALLMSIFKSRPAPFAIMDEVDAALDEANNNRFNQIIQEFVKETQFIIITHSKWTMNSGDRLYGITMQEPGVSTRVSVELNNAQVA